MFAFIKRNKSDAKKIEFQYDKTIMPALKVNIVIVHSWENNTPQVNNYDVHLKYRY
jgi:hypothetical protein